MPAVGEMNPPKDWLLLVYTVSLPVLMCNLNVFLLLGLREIYVSNADEAYKVRLFYFSSQIIDLLFNVFNFDFNAFKFHIN